MDFSPGINNRESPDRKNSQSADELFSEELNFVTAWSKKLFASPANA
jgi:hypothetical protein